MFMSIDNIFTSSKFSSVYSQTDQTVSQVLMMECGNLSNHSEDLRPQRITLEIMHIDDHRQFVNISKRSKLYELEFMS